MIGGMTTHGQCWWRWRRSHFASAPREDDKQQQARPSIDERTHFTAAAISGRCRVLILQRHTHTIQTPKRFMPTLVWFMRSFYFSCRFTYTRLRTWAGAEVEGGETSLELGEHCVAFFCAEASERLKETRKKWWIIPCLILHSRPVARRIFLSLSFQDSHSFRSLEALKSCCCFCVNVINSFSHSTAAPESVQYDENIKMEMDFRIKNNNRATVNGPHYGWSF